MEVDVIWILTAVQLLIGLIVAFMFFLATYSLYRILFIMILESFRLGLSFFWEFKKYSIDAQARIKHYALKAGLGFSLLLFFAWIAHFIEQFKK